MYVVIHTINTCIPASRRLETHPKHFHFHRCVHVKGVFAIKSVTRVSRTHPSALIWKRNTWPLSIHRLRELLPIIYVMFIFVRNSTQVAAERYSTIVRHNHPALFVSTKILPSWLNRKWFTSEAIIITLAAGIFIHAHLLRLSGTVT